MSLSADQAEFVRDAIESLQAHLDEHAECPCQPNRLDVDLLVRAAQEALRASEPPRDTSESPKAPEAVTWLGVQALLACDSWLGVAATLNVGSQQFRFRCSRLGDHTGEHQSVDDNDVVLATW